MFDKANCIDNIYRIAKQNDIKIGDLEVAAGVSKGYLSRINKKESTANPAIEVLSSIAEQLKVSVDFLMNYSDSELTENEKFIMSFLDRVAMDTHAGRLEWIGESAMYVYQTKDKKIDNPLVSTLDDYSVEFDTMYQTNVYQSMFYEGHTDLQGTCYRTKMAGSDAWLYLMYTSYKKKRAFDMDAENVIEVYIMDGEVSPICSTEFVNEKVANVVRDLYFTVNNAIPKVGLNTSARDAINRYMVTSQSKEKLK